MKYVNYCAVILVLALAAGCGQDAKQTPDQLNGRLEAASKMTDPDKKNDALKAVAEDAAASGVGEVAQAAVEKITDPDRKNEVAAACAVKLAKRGDTKAATAVAERITDPDKKNEVLSNISKGR